MSTPDITSLRMKRIYRLCRAYIFISLWSAWLFASMLFCGIGVIACRYMKIPPLFIGACVLFVVILSFAFALRKARSYKLSMSDVAAWLDSKSGAGGLLLALFEKREVRGWEDRIERLNVPEAKADWRKSALFFLASAVFLASCFLVPLPRPAIAVEPPKLNVSSQTSELLGSIKALENAGAVDNEKRKRLEDMIRELENNAAALQPGKIYESLDAIESAVKDIGDNAAGKLMSGAKLMKQMEMAVERLESANDDREAERLLRKWAEQLTESIKNSPALSSNCFAVKGGLKSEKMLSAILKKPPPADEKTLRKLADFLKKSQSKLGKSLKSMCKNGTCSRQAEALKNFLKQNQELSATSGKLSEMWLSEAQERALMRKQEGNGNVGCIQRGRGDAPMFFGQESPSLASNKFSKLESKDLSMKMGSVIGISFASPEAKPVDDKEQGALTSGIGSGGQARRYRVSPRDRNIVRRFFDNSSN